MALLEKKKAEMAPGLTFECDPKNDYVIVRAGGNKFRVKRIDIYTFAFLIADARMQEQLIPVRKEEMMEFKREHTVRLKNNMRAGDYLNISCKVHVPTRVVEGILAAEQEAAPKFRIFPRVSTPATARTA